MTPEQRELTQRIRRRAFRAGDKRAGMKLLRLADQVALMRFETPPRALLEQFRDEDPFMPDIDRKERRPGRPQRREHFYRGGLGSRRVDLEYDRKTGAIAITFAHGEQRLELELDEVQARRLRKAFAMLEPFKWTPGAEEERRKRDG